MIEHVPQAEAISDAGAERPISDMADTVDQGDLIDCGWQYRPKSDLEVQDNGHSRYW